MLSISRHSSDDSLQSRLIFGKRFAEFLCFSQCCMIGKKLLTDKLGRHTTDILPDISFRVYFDLEGNLLTMENPFNILKFPTLSGNCEIFLIEKCCWHEKSEKRIKF